MSGVLSGIKVLDLSWGVAGPIATMLMVDHGAEVTKIEPPGGDPFRDQLGYKAWQRGKRSAVLNLKSEGDNALFLNLVRGADVLVESFSPGTTRKLGIDYETLSAVNPRLIYCSITGYGDLPQHEGRPAYDALVAARSGLLFEHRGWPETALNHFAGRDDPFAEVEIPIEWQPGADREGPILTAVPYPSMGAAYSATLGISAALYARENTGRGQHVETSLLQGTFASCFAAWQRAENIDAEMFNTWIVGSRAPKGQFQCADGRWVHNWVPNPRFILTASAGESLEATPDLSVQGDPDRFGTGPEEIITMAYYHPILAEAMKRFPSHEWIAAAAKAGVTMQGIRSPEEALTDPIVIADRCSTTINDPELGPLQQIGISYTLTDSAGAFGTPAPWLDQHGDEVRLEAKQAVQVAPPSHDAASGSGKGPLAGVRVIDLGLAVAGPYGTQQLSDLGAEVIKINALYDTYWHRNHIAYACNRGKRSLGINLKDPRARAIFIELVRSADVVQHNMRYDAAQRLGVDYESLKAIKPDLIYCHSRGHEHGPRENLPGNDQTAGSLAGVQYEDGGMADGGKPLWPLSSFGDTGNGFLSAIGMIQALLHRKRTGQGQRVDTSIVNAQMLNCSFALARPDGSPLDRPRLDKMQTGLSALYGIYECSDKVWVCIVALRDADIAALEAATGVSNVERRSDGELRAAFAEVFRTKTASAWFETLDNAGVPCEIVNSTASLKMHDDPELLRRQWVVSYRDPFVGKLDQIGVLVNFSDTPSGVQGPPLVVGKDTRDILTELGHSAENAEALIEDGAFLAWREGEVHRAFAGRWAVTPASAPGSGAENTAGGDNVAG